MRKYWIVALFLVAAGSCLLARHLVFHFKAYARVQEVRFVLEAASYTFDKNRRAILPRARRRQTFGRLDR